MLHERIAQELLTLREQDLFRTLRPPLGYDFSSNDYFALSQHPRIVQAVKDAADLYGYGSTSSRFVRGERDIYERVQAKLADFCSTERALIFSSGYGANLGVLSSLLKEDDLVFCDRLNHASIIDGIRLSKAKLIVYPHLDLNFLCRALKKAPKDKAKFLVTESLFSMDGDICRLDILADLARTYNLGLIVDEAHAIGIYGPTGAGLIEHFSVRDEVLCSINGLGKAFGCFGAFVAGKEHVIELITQRARTLMYSTGLPPLAIAAIQEALALIKNAHKERADLQANMQCFDEFRSQALLASPIIPIILGSNERAIAVAKSLQEAGFDIRAIRPPTVPKNTARLRITTNIAHTPELIAELISKLRELS